MTTLETAAMVSLLIVGVLSSVCIGVITALSVKEALE